MNSISESALNALKTIDLTNVSADELINDMVEQSQQFAYRLTIAAELLKAVQRKQDEGKEPIHQSPQAD